MTIDEQIKYMEVGLDALTNALRKDKALTEPHRIRLMDHGIAYSEVIESLHRLKGLEK